MASDSLSQRKAQLDKAEREHLEDVVTEMRERVENNVEFQLTQKGLDDEPEDGDSLDEDTQQLVEAIELEAVDGETWSEAFDQYVTGVGYTIVNRLAALRCMEVRDFIDEEVTVFNDNGLTPAAETLVHEEFLLEDEAILEAYHNACDDLAAEIEILFDRSSAYSVIDPDDDTLEELCEKLDSVPDEVWRADDVLGWVYEYYNVKLLDDLRRKGDREGLEPEDVPPANQFYTPHWVVRMLTDNSLGKLYLEHTGELQDIVEAQEEFSPDERKNRPLSPDESPDIADFCTYLVPSEEEGEPTDFNHPEELRVIDPACGSGHFLLYAFDVLERIWRAETDLPNEDIPRKILQHNLYGVDLDMRACQLAAFNLYLKSRTRAEAEGADGFDMPEVGIVCADATIVEVDGVGAVFEEIAGDDEEVNQALRHILDAFEEVHGLGSLLDVRGTLGDLFEDNSDIEGVQITLGDDPRESHTLGQVLRSLRKAVEEHRESDSFLAQDLRSFVRLLDILAQDYDVALMNPPYGSRKRMPDNIQKYVEDNYEYFPDYYISFVEKCRDFTRRGGRIGVLMPRSFMFKKSFENFRQDFVKGEGSFEFLAEFGLGILDNATVRTVGTILRTGETEGSAGIFYRLHDLNPSSEESVFTSLLSDGYSDAAKRVYRVSMSEFRQVPGTPISYYVPESVRELHDSEMRVDADVAKIGGESIATIATGLQTGNNDRFLRQHWEVPHGASYKPYAKGGSDAWIVPTVEKMVDWSDNASQIRRLGSSRFQNAKYYGKEGVTWTYIKDTGRRFGYLPSGSRFDVAGSMVFPTDVPPLELMATLNSELYHMLMLSLTPERQWNQGDVGRLPWLEQLHDERIEQIGRDQYETVIKQQYNNPTSPYYVGPSLLPATSEEEFFYQSHLFATQETPAVESDTAIAEGDSFSSCSDEIISQRASRVETLEKYATEIDTYIHEALELGESVQEAIQREIELRGSLAKAGDGSTRNFSIEREVKDLIHHFGMEVVRDEPAGIIPVHDAGERDDMLDHIVERFEEVYGEYAEEHLVEADEILGTEPAAEEAYPNLRAFIAEDLFDYHVDRMENTPIVWRFTTERLVSDSTGEGFACFVDYHSIDSGLFDRLANRYLEPRKAELRERRSAANRRRNDDSLLASEQAEAAEQYERCASGLDQIAVFEDVLQKLGSTDERDFDAEDRERVGELASKVAAFREETRERVETLADLRERKGEAWFQETFSDNFWNAVDEWRDEWLDALKQLEHACEAYGRPSDEPVEAHLADLFNYFNRRIKGSDHYSSTGILFMTYYFEREGAALLDEDGNPHDNLTEDERLLARLATGLDDPSLVEREYLEAMVDDNEEFESVADLPPLAEFKALAEEIDDRCQAVNNQIPSEWADRALSEITTAGYQPNRKHGVEINIAPLAGTEIVPKTVDDQVL